MKRTAVCILVSLSLLVAVLPAGVSAVTRYSDVPGGNWSEEYVDAASRYGLMQGTGGDSFGFGRPVTKAEFVTILCRMFQWEPVEPPTPSYPDVARGQWHYPYVETALANGVVEKTPTFNPDAPILREEMAVMLVRAFGYQGIAGNAARYGHPFADVSDNAGYITVAYDIGMIRGTGATTFAPKSTAKREEAAAMLVRVYEKRKSPTTWFHGFYAFSSFGQRELTGEMDAVSAGWSQMGFDPEEGALLDTTGRSGNEWRVPDSYEDITGYLETNGTPLKLNVFMDARRNVTLPDGSNTNMGKAILLDPVQRTQAVQAILEELARTYEAAGRNPYSGVTVDFEGLRGGEMKEGYNAFLEELAAGLASTGKTLYVMVHPAVWNSPYFDGYDYRTIGRLADKVVLMAHDYQPTSLQGYEGTAWHRNAALTPIGQVYYALRAVTDPITGVEDREKVALAISFTSIAWTVSDGLLVSGTPVQVATPTVYSRLTAPGTVMGYSEVYRNPYITYRTESGTEIFLWYEDGRSVRDKVQLAKMFGIRGVSFWRLGLVPDYPDGGLHYDVMEAWK
ncbi:S-layer homology domain-containing protein [Anaerotalea alkaliphila]|uniref:S-layer homology domain-containing protein n=1 Tax=Anaerotalea alkaliphila TaxID=2662126 RepID=A0A7X5HVK1_9FIRM|nr:S-layer homology domain-containing protein [Anaerotalea alkaliphila]NDL67465.1 hypothetical protein [Anaerotalea alkaliphila]